MSLTWHNSVEMLPCCVYINSQLFSIVEGYSVTGKNRCCLLIHLSKDWVVSVYEPLKNYETSMYRILCDSFHFYRLNAYVHTFWTGW